MSLVATLSAAVAGRDCMPDVGAGGRGPSGRTGERALAADRRLFLLLPGCAVSNRKQAGSRLGPSASPLLDPDSAMPTVCTLSFLENHPSLVALAECRRLGGHFG